MPSEVLECPVCLNSLFESSGFKSDDTLETVGKTSRASNSNATATVTSATLNSTSTDYQESANTANLLPKAESCTSMEATEAITSAISATPCGHLFHSVCLANWFKQNRRISCPCCRKPCTKAKMTKVYLDYGTPLSRPLDSRHVVGHSRAIPGGSLSGGIIPQNNSDGLKEVASNGNPTACTSRTVENLKPTTYSGDCLDDLKSKHQTLVKDFNELKEKYYDLKDEADLRKALFLSLHQEQKHLKAELQKYGKIRTCPTVQEKRKVPKTSETETKTKPTPAKK